MKATDIEKARSINEYIAKINDLLNANDLQVINTGCTQYYDTERCPRFKSEYVKSREGQLEKIEAEENLLIKQALKIKKEKAVLELKNIGVEYEDPTWFNE